MKKESVNTFEKGLNLDLNPVMTPNSVLTENLNGTFITYNGNEFCLQNDKGNFKVASLSDGYVPIGAKEYNGIIYIVSVKNAYTDDGEIDSENCLTEIGTYPGLDWNPTLYKTTDPDDSSVKYYDKYEKELDLITPESEAGKENPRNCYTPLCNFNVGEDSEGYSEYGNPLRAKLGYSTITPVTIEIQPSYDGSVNLILTDGKNPVRMVNSGFSVLPENKYKLIKRNQTEATNTYDEDRLDELNLIRTTNIITNVALEGVLPGGQFKGGNYTFYIKFGDADYNQTDVVAESGIISIFRGTDCVPISISGTVLDERTDKMIGLKIIGINRTYSKIYIYYSREYSDTLGNRMTEWSALKEPIDIKPDTSVKEVDGELVNIPESELEQTIWLTGYEQTQPIDREEINIDYHTFDSARAETQLEKMLFLGNLKMEETYKLYDNLNNLAKQISTELKATDLLDQVSYSYNTNKVSLESNAEYYSTQNIYNKLGYWPGEIYRFGIVFILKDGATTPVFNMRGGILEKTSTGSWAVNYNTTDEAYSKCINNYGVFKLPEHSVYTGDKINPLHFEFKLPNISQTNAIRNNVIGYFYVRQKRIPITLCQGVTLGVDTRSHLPVTWNGKRWITQSFLSLNRKTINNPELRVVATDDNTNADLLPSLQYYGASVKIDTNPRTSSIPDTATFIKFGVLYDADSTSTYASKQDALNAVDSLSIPQKWVGYDDDEAFDGADTVYVYQFNPGCQAQLQQTQGTGFYVIDMQENTNVKYFYITPKTISELPKIITAKYSQELAFIYWGTDYAEISNYIQNYDNDNVVLGASQKKANGFENRYIVYPSDGTSSRPGRENASRGQYVNSCALLSLDPCVSSTVRNVLDGSVFGLKEEYTTTGWFGTSDLDDDALKGSYSNDENAMIWYKIGSKQNSNASLNHCVFVPSNTGMKEMDGIGFSNVCGSATDVSKYGFTSHPIAVWTSYEKKRGNNNNNLVNWYNLSDEFNIADEYTIQFDSDGVDYLKGKQVGFNSVTNVNIVRGLFTPFIGTNNKNLHHSIYSIQLEQPKNENSEIDWDKALFVREQDASEYYTASKRFLLPSTDMETNSKNYTQSVYRGDCFTNTVSMRIIRNFIDQTAPIADTIIDTWCWNQYVRKAGDYKSNDVLKEQEWKDRDGIPKWEEVNISDVNTVDLGYWVTFKCLSSYNLGLRSLDYSHVDEMKLLGSPRSFHPINGMSTATGNKMEESYLLNDGLSATVGEKTYNLIPDVPYFPSEFANRIIFSNVQVDNAFTNGYRTFQGVSYQDYDKQYGAIVKLIPWQGNLVVVMEHGIGVVGVNEKALIQTSTSDVVHIYGHGVLSDHIEMLSSDFGSKYEHSVIRTPIGIYGVDTDARKIWRINMQGDRSGSIKGFETISDMKIESYLNDNLFTNENVEMEICDVRTHYNETKGDIMFTFFKKKAANTAKKSKIKSESYPSTTNLTYDFVGQEKSFTVYSTTTPSIQTYGGVEVTNVKNDGNNTWTVTTRSTDDGNGDVIVNDSKVSTNVVSETKQYSEEQAAIDKKIEEDNTPLTLKINGLAAAQMPVGSVSTRTVSINKSNITLDNLTLVASKEGYVSLSKSEGKLKIKALKETSQVSVWLKYGDVTSSKIHIEVTPEKPFIIDQESPITVIQGTRGSFTASNVDNITAKVIEGATNVDYVQQHSDLAITFYADKVGTTKFEVTGYIDGTKVPGKKTVTVNIVADIPITRLHWDPTNSIVKNLAPGGTAHFTMNKGDRVTLKFLPEPYDYNTKVYSKTIGAAIEHGSFVGDHTITSIYCSMRTNSEYMEGEMAGRVLFIANKAGHCKYEMNIWKNDREKVLTYYFDVTVNE